MIKSITRPPLLLITIFAAHTTFLKAETPEWVPPTVAVTGALGGVAIWTHYKSINSFFAGVFAGVGSFLIAKKLLWPRTRTGVTRQTQALVEEYNNIVEELSEMLKPYDMDPDICATLNIVHADSVWPLAEGFSKLQYLLQQGHADQLNTITQRAQTLLQQLISNHNLPELVRIVKIVAQDSAQAHTAYSNHIRNLLLLIKQNPEFVAQWKSRTTELAQKRDLELRERQVYAEESAARAAWLNAMRYHPTVNNTTVINNIPNEKPE